MIKRKNEIELIVELEPPPTWATSGVPFKSSLARNIFLVKLYSIIFI